MTDPPLDHPLGPASMPPSDLGQLLALAAGAPVDPDVIHLLWHLDPTAVPAVTLLHATVLCRRLVSSLEAVEQSVVAALARPGVAVPLARVVDAARWSAAKPGELAAPDAVLERTLDPVTDPRCAAAVAQHAARFAAMEIGAALHLSPLTAPDPGRAGAAVVDAMPRTLTGDADGRLDGCGPRFWPTPRSVLTPDRPAAVEAEVLGTAGSCTPSRLRAVVARTILRLDPDGAADRANAARTRRDVYSRPPTRRSLHRHGDHGSRQGRDHDVAAQHHGRRLRRRR